MAWDREKERKAGKTMTIGSSIFGIVFVIVWCILAVSMGAWFMLLFGLPMLGMMIYRLAMILQLSKEEKKPPQESEPWDRPPELPKQNSGSKFCPYCGRPLQEAFSYCPDCGRKL